MSNPLVSWLMPVYNCERTLCRALDSMLGQTYYNVEVVVINDGSSDHSPEILEQYAQKDNRIKVYHNEYNMGISQSLNRGLELCNGKYIARMDADDFSYPERIEKQTAFMEDNHEIGILGTSVKRVYEASGLTINEYVPVKSEEIRCWLLFNIQARHPTIMFRTEVVRKLNLKYPSCPAEDYALFASLVSKVKMANLQEALVNYYVGTDMQLTAVFRERIRQDNIAISRATIQKTLGMDISGYPDSFFGARGNDIVPYDIKKFLQKAGEFLNKMVQCNQVKKCFEQDYFEKQLENEWGSMKAMVHMHSFQDFSFQQSSDRSIVDSVYDEACAMEYPSGNVIIYGTGSYAVEHIPILFDEVPYEIIAFCDSNPQKHGKEFLGKKIISPEEIHTLSYDYIFIAAPVYYGDIEEELIRNRNVLPSKIVNFQTIMDIKFFHDRKKWIGEFNHQNSRQKAYLFCAPDYNNLGDHAIAYAEKEFLRRNLNIEIAEIPTRRFRDAVDIARYYIKPDDLLLVTGGGFLGSLWMNTENMTRKVIEMFPDNRIIIMPQTLYWSQEVTFKKEALHTKEIYEKHKNLTLCARDKISMELMKTYYPKNQVMLVPDMALSIDWKGMVKKGVKRDGALLCLKNDKESVLTEKQKEYIWNVCQRFTEKISITSNLHKYAQIELDERKELICQQLQRFSGAMICITDRLHGMIFSAITETPCVVLNNCNHKLKSGYIWVERLPYICFVEDINHIQDAIRSVIETENKKFDSAEFSAYYEGLIELIKDGM